jgi:hypothetical protein
MPNPLAWKDMPENLDISRSICIPLFYLSRAGSSDVVMPFSFIQLTGLATALPRLTTLLFNDTKLFNFPNPLILFPLNDLFKSTLEYTNQFHIVLSRLMFWALQKTPIRSKYPALTFTDPSIRRRFLHRRIDCRNRRFKTNMSEHLTWTKSIILLKDDTSVQYP